MRAAYPMKAGGHDRTAGFTLIELATVLIVSGFIMVVLMDALLYKIHQDQRTKTLASLSNAQAALTEFVGNNLRYPCPADPALGPGDPNYGMEMVNAAGKCTMPSIAPGYIRGNDPNHTDPTHQDTVYFGALPFMTIMPTLTYASFSATDTIDGWGDKLGYAVTGSLTKATSFDDKHGGIEIVDEYKNSLLQPPSSAHLVVYSLGQDGRGAYTQAGKLVQSCAVSLLPPPPTAPIFVTPENEWENCTNTDNVFLSGLKYTEVNSFNDDIVKFLSVQNGNFWNITGCVDTVCHSTPLIYKVENTNSGNVGIGIDNPSEKLDINGPLVAQTGNLQTTSFCDQSGGNCMPPNLLGGQVTDMDCAYQGSNMVMTGISNNKAVCAKVVFPTKAYSCASGHFLTAISNLGNFVCN